MPALARPLVIALLLAMLGLMVAATASRSRALRADRKDQPTTQPAPAVKPAALAVTDVKRPEAPRNPGYTLVRVRAGHAVALRARPAGRRLARVSARTEFGSPEVLTVVKRRGRWLGVTSTQLPNGRLGWIDARSAAIRTAHTRWSLRADLSRKRLELRRGKRIVRRIDVAIGAPGSTTPTGRFQVTDKLAGSRYGAYYGCCILALSGHQPNTPAGWRGGDRLAIHGTDVLATVGRAASAGCLRARDEDLRALMRKVPLGTPVFISS
jgi:hypothetical protein